MYLDIAGLTNAKDAISSLVFYRWIPPTIKVKNMVSRVKLRPTPPALSERIIIGDLGVVLGGLSFPRCFFTGAIQNSISRRSR